jgi:PKHD-type hydroxylase
VLLEIPGLLGGEEVTSVVNALGRARFVDGRLTAGEAARSVKHNEELDRGSEIRDVLARALVGSLYRSERFRAAVLPHRISTPLVARYQPGMAYGDHVDDPVMGEGDRYRSDVSVTIFLTPPESYDGGELVIRTAFGEQRVKLGAGDAVIYPSSSLHRVAEVTRGERLVGLCWVQSLVRDPAQRELLFELGQARERLLANARGSEESDWVDRSYVNLLRMWSEL